MNALRRKILATPTLRQGWVAAANLRDGIRDPHPWKAARREAQKSDVVMLGPWLGEVGPEFGYWIPYLRQLKNNGVFEGKKVVAVSRGGVQAWYSGIADDYIELLTLLSTADFKAARSEQATAKQIRWTNAERGILRKAADKAGVKNFAAAHPGLMWEQIGLWVRSRRRLDWLLERSAYAPFGSPTAEIQSFVDGLGLPKRFTFVRFYSSKLFPWNEKTQSFCHEIAERLLKRGPVVTMGLKSSLDDHEHLSVTGVIDLSDRLPQAINLGVQTELVRRSEGFVGTYGGLSVLPAFVGKSSLSFYSESLQSAGFEDIHFRHEAITTEIYRQLNQPYQVVNLNGWGLLEGLLDSN